MKIKIDTSMWAYFFSDLSDKERLELVKVLIHCHPDSHMFRERVLKTVEKMEVD